MLFDRIRRRLALYENKRALVPHAPELLDRDRCLARRRQLCDRQVRSAGHGGALLARSALQPRACVHPQHHCRHAALASCDVEVGFLERQQTRPDLALHPRLDDKLVAITSAGHPPAEPIATPRQLAAQHRAPREPRSGTCQVADVWLVGHLQKW